MQPRYSWVFAAVVIAQTAYGAVAPLPIAAGTGPDPQMPPPNPTLIPTVNIAQAASIALNKPSALLFADDFSNTRWREMPSTARLPSDANGANRSLTSKTQMPHGTNGNQFGC